MTPPNPSRRITALVAMLLACTLVLAGCSADSHPLTATAPTTPAATGTLPDASVGPEPPTVPEEPLSTLSAPGEPTASASASGAAKGSDGEMSLPTNGLSQGTFTEVWVGGKASHYRSRVEIWVPKHAGKGPSPVLMALHGWPGRMRMITHNMRLMDNLVKAWSAHRMRLPVVIIPEWGVSPDNECVNGDKSHQVESWLAIDLVHFMRTHYHVMSGPSGWATYGYSAGAWCATMLAMKHPDVFGAAISMSGYSSPEFGTPTYRPFLATSARGLSYDLPRLARLTPPSVSLYLLTDAADPESYPSTMDLLRAIRRPTRAVGVLGVGGHAVKLWIPGTAAALVWLGRTLSGFRWQ